MRRFFKKNKFLKQVRELALTWVHPDQADIFLFGSWAKGSQKKHSDIDLAILPKKPLSADLLPKLREAFEESRVPYRVEVVDLSSTDAGFRKTVEQRGILWT